MAALAGGSALRMGETSARQMTKFADMSLNPRPACRAEASPGPTGRSAVANAARKDGETSRNREMKEGPTMLLITRAGFGGTSRC
jgi:hypothetical protein